MARIRHNLPIHCGPSGNSTSEEEDFEETHQTDRFHTAFGHRGDRARSLRLEQLIKLLVGGCFEQRRGERQQLRINGGHGDSC